MIIVGINGSPRKNGNTELLLDSALKSASTEGAKIEKINIGNLKFAPCLSCSDARKDGVCKVKDDMAGVFRSIYEADAIIVASPVYFGSVSAQTKMMIDRFQCRWAALNIHKSLKHGRKRPGAFICVEASSKNEFFENAESIIRNLFATIDVNIEAKLYCKGIEEKGAVLKTPKCLQKASVIGLKVTALAKMEKNKQRILGGK